MGLTDLYETDFLTRLTVKRLAELNSTRAKASVAALEHKCNTSMHQQKIAHAYATA